MTLALALLGLAIVLGACATNNTPPTVTKSVTSVAIDQGDASLQVGDTLALTVTVDVKGGASTAVTWSSSDAGVASVSASGTVTAVAVGTAQITATSDFDNAKSDAITVTVVSAGVDPDNIYVDASAAAGGDGSAAAPFQTIAEGVAAVNSGGTVHVAAGEYPEALYLDKPLALAGAGSGSVTIVADGNATGAGSSAGMVVYSTSGTTLSGFTLRIDAPGPSDWALAAYGVVDNLTIQDVVIQDTIDNSAIGGLELFGVTTGTVQNVTITAPAAAPSDGAGFRIVGTNSGIQVTGLATSGHSGYAGALLEPMGGTISNVTIQGTFAEVNKLEIKLDGGGTVTGLTADQFQFVARNTDAAYGGGDYWFYKESEAVALADALFNFEADGVNGGLSFVQRVDPTDEGQLLNEFVAGEIDGATNGYPGATPAVRSSNVQSAIDAAADGGSILVRGGTFDGALTLDVPNLTITGAGATSVLTSDPLPVLTVAAAGVQIASVQIDSSDAAHYAVLVNNQTGFALTASNLLSALVLDNVGGNAVDATANFWGGAGAPDGDDINGTNVDASGSVGSAYP